MTPLLLVLLCIPVDVDGSTPVECGPASPEGKGRVVSIADCGRNIGERALVPAAGTAPGHSAGVEASTSVETDGPPSVSTQGASRLEAGDKSAAGRGTVAAAINVGAGDVAMPDSWWRCGSGVPTPCEASEKPAPVQSRNREGGPSVSTPFLVYGGSALADYLSTRHALDAGAVERNPLMRGHARLIGMKAFQVLALTYLDVELQKRGHTKAVKFLRIGAGFVAAVLVGNNLWVEHQQRRLK